MKNDRFLVVIVAGIALLAVLAVSLFLVRRGQVSYQPDDTPEGVVHNYTLALYQENYERAYGYLADLPNKPTLEQFRQSFYNQLLSNVQTSLKIEDSHINGEDARVTVALTHSQGDPFSAPYRDLQSALLTRQNGAWKLKSMPYPFWMYDWYQENPKAIPAP